MSHAVDQLSDKEKEVLRLLLAGHDAKSIASQLDLSVHTVNDRLRHARRKLGASSSRTAARILGKAEGAAHNNLAHNDIGVGAGVRSHADREQSQPGHSRISSGVWLAGGMLLMSLLIAVALVLVQGSGVSGDQSPSPTETGPDLSTQAEGSAALADARSWVSIVDREDWEGSWVAASQLFQSQVSASQWAITVRPVREPLGAVLAREFRSVMRAESLPGAPDGEYEIIEFTTSFSNLTESVETVVMVQEADGWKTAGYFIRPS